MIITVDGQSSSGKSSLACALANRLGYHFLGSGAIYRLVANALLDGKNIDDYIDTLESRLDFALVDGEMRVLVSRKDFTDSLQDNAVSQKASEIAKDPILRTKLLVLQKSFDKAPGLVAEGRDMGSIVFPKSPVKFFLISKIEERARRRLEQLQDKSMSLPDMIDLLEKRDEQDETREVSPLIIPNGALVMDTSDKSKAENLEHMWEHVQSLSE